VVPVRLAWTAQTADEPGADRIADRQEDDGDRLSHLLSRLRGLGGGCNEEVHRDPDKFGRQIGKAIHLEVRPTILNGDVLAVDVTEIAQPLEECLRIPGRTHRNSSAEREIPDPRHFLPWWRC